MSKHMPIVEVEWIDSAHHSGWTTKADWEGSLDAKPYITCRTAGYLLRKSRDAVSVVQSSQDDGSEYIDSVMIIPRVAVTSIVILKK